MIRCEGDLDAREIMAMTLTTDFAYEKRPNLVPVRTMDGARTILRLLQRLVGCAMVAAALFLWIAPGASWESDILLFKLVMSATAILAGIGLFQSSAAPLAPTVEIDAARDEVRLVRGDGFGGQVVLDTCAFADIELAEHEGSTLRLWAANQREIADMTLSDFDALNEIVLRLKAHGKLA